MGKYDNIIIGVCIIFILGFDSKILATLLGTFMGYLLTGVGEK